MLWITSLLREPNGGSDRQQGRSWQATSSRPVGSLLPAATESIIELDQCQAFVQLRLRQVQLRRERPILGVKNLQVAGDAPRVADVCQASRIDGCIGHQPLLLTKLL